MKQVRPKKNLGQHFLTDLSIARRIADTVDACPGLPVLEVGPGMGVLTQFLMEKPRPLHVVEIDAESVAYLKERFGNLTPLTPHPSPLNIIEGDFLRMDLHSLFGGGQFVLTGNYPYDISSQIFFKMLDNRDLIPCCTGAYAQRANGSRLKETAPWLLKQAALTMYAMSRQRRVSRRYARQRQKGPISHARLRRTTLRWTKMILKRKAVLR